MRSRYTSFARPDLFKETVKAARRDDPLTMWQRAALLPGTEDLKDQKVTGYMILFTALRVSPHLLPPSIRRSVHLLPLAGFVWRRQHPEINDLMESKASYERVRRKVDARPMREVKSQRLAGPQDPPRTHLLQATYITMVSLLLDHHITGEALDAICTPLLAQFKTKVRNPNEVCGLLLTKYRPHFKAM